MSGGMVATAMRWGWDLGAGWLRVVVMLMIGFGTDSRGYLLSGMAVVLWDMLRPRGGDPSPEFGWDGGLLAG